MRFDTLLVLLLGLTLLAALVPPAGAGPLRAGDVVAISLPGEAAFEKPFQVDRRGRLTLPEVGAVVVAGLEPEAARVELATRLGGAYRDLDRFELRLVERRLPVTVLGYVKTPGPAELPEGGNVQMALAAAGGLAPGAQLDRLQLRRGAEVIPFDYKRYLDSGEGGALPSLEPLDVLFVPASPLIGNVQVEFDAATLVAGGDAGETGGAVKVFGEVNNPGSFSHKAGATVVDLLMRAGGVTRHAGVERIRVIDGGEPLLFDLKGYLDSGDGTRVPKPGPGATIFVPRQEEAVKRGARTVYVMGEVFKPGAYEIDGEQGVLLDILANAGGPTRFADSRRLRILRADGRVVPFDLGAYSEGNRPGPVPRMASGDALFVPEKSDFNEKSWLNIAPGRAVRVIGAVHKPGRYEWSGEMSLLDLLAHAGGPTERADTAHLRVLGGQGRVTPTLFDLERFLNQGGDLGGLPRLAAGYTVVVPELPEDPGDNKSSWLRQPAAESVYVFGQVGAPGRYAFNGSMGFLDILAAADGPTGEADIHNIRVTQRRAGGSRVVQFDLGRYLGLGDESLLPEVRPGDAVYVPERNPPWLDEAPGRTVRVFGAVAKPGRYRFDDSMTLLDLLAEAGGPTAGAHLERIALVNVASGGAEGSTFDLPAFVADPDFSRLPVVRAGDTVFVPDTTSSAWNGFMDGVKDLFSILSVVALVGGI